jgi:uncharacterized membrane protein
MDREFMRIKTAADHFDVSVWTQGAPTSLEHARGFYLVTNPGLFFRIVSPATQLFLLLALVCNWKPPVTRWSLAGALVLAILADVITFKFHYPRNSILFLAPLTGRQQT